MYPSYKHCLALTLTVAVSYVAFIPALFDFNLNPAYVVERNRYHQEVEYYSTYFDVEIHDGPSFQQDLKTIWERANRLEDRMMQDHQDSTPAAIPRWYTRNEDYYYLIQRRSFIHNVYPFL